MSKSGIRVKIDIECDGNIPPFFIEPMPAIPRNGDLILIDDMINEQAFSSDQLNYIYKYLWNVEAQTWKKDKQGYYVELYCAGE